MEVVHGDLQGLAVRRDGEGEGRERARVAGDLAPVHRRDGVDGRGVDAHVAHLPRRRGRQLAAVDDTLARVARAADRVVVPGLRVGRAVRAVRHVPAVRQRDGLAVGRPAVVQRRAEGSINEIEGKGHGGQIAEAA